MQFLVFDRSDDVDGRVTLEAMASVTDAQLPALQAEVAQVMRWCEAHGGPRGPVEDGGCWEADLHGVLERHCAEDWHWQAGQWRLQADGPELRRHALTLTLSGEATWADALCEGLGLLEP